MVGARTGDLAIQSLQDDQGRVWRRDQLQAALNGLPRDPGLPACVPPELPQPGPTGHGLLSLSLAAGRARALVACPPTRRVDGAWDFDVPGVVSALDYIQDAAGQHPLVVLLPWEWHQGPGDGSHALTARLERLLARPMTRIVAPTGNFGDRTALWQLDGQTEVHWCPSGDQGLLLWSLGPGLRVTVDGANLPSRQQHGWFGSHVRSNKPVRLHIVPEPGFPVRLRAPFPSTGSLLISPPATSLGSVGYPACHPGVIAVGSDHWSSARGLGGPDVLASWTASAAVRADSQEACDLFAPCSGTSVAAALHAACLLAPFRDPCSD